MYGHTLGLVKCPNDISLLRANQSQECCGRDFAAKLGEFEYSENILGKLQKTTTAA